jgi:MFS family permease
MDSEYQQRLEKNINKYSWFKVFTKRVYLPLIAIQLVTEGKVTVSQLAIIVAITSVVQIILQMPAGYLADKWGSRRAILLGSSLGMLSPLFYIFLPNFAGGLIASLLFFGGYAFISGSIEAFMHDTLLALGKEKQYARVMGRAQSYGLIGNVVLITLVPATYAINHNLPFLLGFVSQAVMLWLAASFTYPVRESAIKRKNPFAAVKSIVTAQNIALFIFAGVMSGIAHRGVEFRELLFQDIGIAVAFFGFILAVGSLLGAVMGRFIHLLDNLKPLHFYFFDLSFLATGLMLVGVSRQPWLAITGFTLFVGYTRVRLIVFQAKLLHDIQHVYKATLISALNLFSLIAELGVVILLARLIDFKGYSLGYLLFGLATLVSGLLLWGVLFIQAKRGAIKSDES